MEIHLSPNQRPRPQGKQPDLIIIHATAGGFDGALETLRDPSPVGRGPVSAHYLIGKTGRLIRLVEEDQEAWHAGESAWEGFPGLSGSLNWRTIGIELENLNNGQDPYPDAQLAVLVDLLRAICRRWDIPADRRHIVGHSEITDRKSDPLGLNLDKVVREVAAPGEFAGRYRALRRVAIHQACKADAPIAGHLEGGETFIVDALKDDPTCTEVCGDRRWVHLADGRGFTPLAHVYPEEIPAHQGLTFLAEPRITRTAFAQVLADAGSSARDVADPLYDVFVAEGVDPAVALAFFQHESGCGTRGICKRYATLNWGNCRTAHREALASGMVDTPGGPFARYPSWEHGARNWCARIKDHYIGERGLTTVELAIPYYAPSSDGNRPAAYVNAVRRMVAGWRPAQPWLALREANIREAPRQYYPNGKNVKVVGQLCPGDSVLVDLIKQGPDCETIDGEGRWAHLADGRGFAWLRNLRRQEEPAVERELAVGQPDARAAELFALDTAQRIYDDEASDRYARRSRQREELQQLAAQEATDERRIMGANDLVSVSYLAAGLSAARAVCRIQVEVRNGQPQGYGTGFLVSPTLLLTNNHVLDSAQAARASLADFNYEEDADAALKRPAVFALDPDRFFTTDRALDFTLVAVAPNAADGTALAAFGTLPLREADETELLESYVSILQHPRGMPKRAALRENRVVDVLDAYLHYSTDTEPGSSGSPVFDDQWQVVALHHAGVKKRDAAGRVLTPDGRIWQPAMGEALIGWVANEGVRAGSICAALRDRYEGWAADQQALIDEVLAPAPIAAPGTPVSFEVAELDREWYAAQAGYDPAFLGPRVELPRLPEARRDDAVPLSDGSGHELTYPHFSVVMSKERRLAHFTATNIDGAQLERPPRRKDRWYFDPRIDQAYQSGPELYRRNDLDLGHLVRRLDPVWGPEAGAAEEATFHFTNCAPQHKHLNQRTWLDLEDYILKNAATHGMKVSVFTGAVFRADDMRYRGEYQIPAEFWKVVAIVKDDGALSATAYLQTQKQLIGDLEFAYGPYRTYQVPVTTIEGLTGLDFGALRDHDPLANIEATAGRAIEGPEDLRL